MVFRFNFSNILRQFCRPTEIHIFILKNKDFSPYGDVETTEKESLSNLFPCVFLFLNRRSFILGYILVLQIQIAFSVQEVQIRAHRINGFHRFLQIPCFQYFFQEPILAFNDVIQHVRVKSWWVHLWKNRQKQTQWLTASLLLCKVSLRSVILSFLLFISLCFVRFPLHSFFSFIQKS